MMIKARDAVTTFASYEKGFPLSTRQRLRVIRAIVLELAPEATEKISYQMPAFFLNGALVWYAAFEHHIGFYPGASGVEAFIEEMKQYKHAKGSIQFPHDRPLPIALIKRIVRYRVKENLAKPAKRIKSK